MAAKKKTGRKPGRKKGRPKSPAATRRGEYLAFRVTPAQAQAIDAACLEDGMTRSEWLRGIVATALRRRQ